VHQITDGPEADAENAIRSPPADLSNKADPARIMFMRGIIEVRLRFGARMAGCLHAGIFSQNNVPVGCAAFAAKLQAATFIPRPLPVIRKMKPWKDFCTFFGISTDANPSQHLRGPERGPLETISARFARVYGQA
jgi:hypothetical protein